MNLISQKLDEWQRASKNDVDRELINSCVAQITPLTNEEFRWVLDFQMSEVQARNAAASHCAGYSAVRDLSCTGQRFLNNE